MPRGRFFAKVQVNNRQISALFQPGGQVFDEGRAIGRETIARAVIRAPKRTGTLSRSHQLNVAPTGLYGTIVSVGNTASYSEYVHGGTFGPIRSRRPVDRRGRPPGKMGPAAPGLGGDREFFVEVSGQDPNPWLRESANDVLLRYGVRVYDSD